MNQSVVLKSNRYGINLLLDSNTPFEQLIVDIIKTFKDSEKFFQSARVAISFEGRKLTSQEEQEIIIAITQNTSIDIICVIDNDETTQNKVRKQIENYERNHSSRNGQFYRGTLRSGQMIEAENSIIVLGDVNPGAKIISKGNIVILGSLRGTAYAGAAGNEDAFVAASVMNPIQIRIGDVIGRSEDGAPWRPQDYHDPTEPQVAVVRNQAIALEAMTKGTLFQL